MKLRSPWLSAAMWLLIVSSASAQVGQRNALLTSGLASRLRSSVQFEIVGGRIVASSMHVGATNMTSTTSGNGGRRERLSIDLTNSTPKVRYELSEKGQEITLEVTDGEQILLRHTQKADQGTQSIEFAQPPRQDLALTIEGPDGKRVVHGPTLWHLLLAEPEVTRQRLAPIMEIFKPGWNLAAVADAIEEALCQNARLRHSVDREHWTAQVARLSSPSYADRQAAERELLEIGREVLPFLRGYERATLDAEQWRRIRNVIAALDNQQGNSVDQTVTLLAGDPRAWVSLLSRDEEAKRQLAVEQLKSITGEPIDFDPAATAEVREQQLQKLRTRFNPPPAVKTSDKDAG